MANGEAMGLKLFIVHETATNEYRVLTHNFTCEEAESFLREWKPHLVEGARMIAIDQPKRHQTNNPEECKACRQAVARNSGIDPRPKFKRRKV